MEVAFFLEKFFFDSKNTKDLRLDTFKIKETNLILSFFNINFNKYKNINIFLKNLKTNEIIHLNHNFYDNSIIIDINNFSELCLDYEFTLFIFAQNNDENIVFLPKFKNKNLSVKDFLNIFNDTFNLYIRILDNEYIALSSIKLFKEK